ncbi:hypothetical protein ACFY8Q_23050 [[Kitasatospora] papulosa]|uniref:hypothetical protein n=1 Tax=[Kitasatospora] papulosa TaxID=1464011 RepID=UPI0036A9A4B3
MNEQVVPYVIADSEQLNSAVIRDFKKSRGDGVLIVTGDCPRCLHEFTATIPLTPSTVTPGRAITGQAAGHSMTATPVQHTVYCSCQQEHEGRPDGEHGCGAVTNVMLNLKVRR